MEIKVKPKKKGEIKKIIPQYDFLYDFSNTFNDSLFNLDIFYKNIKTLKFINGKKMKFNFSIAEYDLMHNSIRFSDENYKVGIMHEIFHLSSTIIGKKRIYSGFSQVDILTNDSIGWGFNEGYTALLDDKYFPDYTSDKKEVLGNSYLLTKHFVGMIEEAIGHEEMIKMYSTCDLKTLTDILASRTSMKNTLNFYKALDIICYYLESKRPSKYLLIFKAIQFAIKYTALLYLDIMQEAYIKREISDLDYYDFIDDLKLQLSKPFIIGKIFKIQTIPIVDADFHELINNSMKKCLKKYT